MITHTRTDPLVHLPIRTYAADEPLREYDAESLWNELVAQPSEHIHSGSSLSPDVEAEVQQVLRLSSLLQNYICSNLGEVYTYLSTHAKLFPILEEAPAVVRLLYGPTVMKLEVLHESEEKWSRLFLVIQSSLDSDKLLSVSERFADEWVAPRLAIFDSESFSVTEEPV